MTQQSVQPGQASAADPQRPTPRTGGLLLKELTMPIVLAAFATYLLVNMLVMDVPDSVDFPGPRFFPAIVTGVIYLLVILQVIASVRHWSAGNLTVEGEDAAVRFSWSSLLWVVGGFLGFSLLLEFLGWIIAAGLLFWCVAQGFGSKKPIASLITGLTVSSIAYIAFDMALGLSLPSGILGGGF
ncbi:tripartite tricarboxylate transporter TctB family protein [Rothia halotolerans]|uniref:tripartite tricarboxylate transporter TctB family protein n=1 Tax=Rothia halotolerans TaxID=405770 RepID=UPI001EE10583|nr:tripartite tricarboxylate transporter TctB family protein [Rothia halotolerans]